MNTTYLTILWTALLMAVCQAFRLTVNHAAKSSPLLPPSTRRCFHPTILSSSTRSSTTITTRSTTTALGFEAALLSFAEIDPESVPLSQAATIGVFAVGLLPFVVATVEFWRRIAFGESFGTGSDSIVIIGQDDAPVSSRGRRVLGKDALVAAYILFGIATAVLGLVVYSVLTSAPPAEG